jgi:hypothetical protein
MEDHLLSSTLHNFYALDFEYIDQFLVALVPMSLTVIFHGLGMDMVRRYFKRFGQPLLKRPHVAARAIVMSGIVGIMLASHFFGIVIWAAFYLATGLLSDVHKAMFFSAESYTTLGASNIELAGRWLGFGGLEAMTGVLMFGWSTAILAAIVQKLHSIDD